MTPRTRRTLFLSYATMIGGLVSVLLATCAGLAMYLAFVEAREALAELQREKARSAAATIEHFIGDIDRRTRLAHELFVAAQLAGDAQEARLEYLRLLRQMPSVWEVRNLGPDGHERLYVSRLHPDSAGSGADHSSRPEFRAAAEGRALFGPVYFAHESEPFAIIAVGGPSRGAGVTLAEVNLKVLWDVVSLLRVGGAGQAYVTDGRGLLIAHRDLSLVLRRTDLSGFGPVRSALASGASQPAGATLRGTAEGSQTSVLITFRPIRGLDAYLFIEQPEAEALAPVYGLLWRMAALLALGLVLSLAASAWLARRMVNPVRALEAAAERIAAGNLDQRIEPGGADELGRLAEQFNRMTAQLRGVHAGLERTVESRTLALKNANEAKTRFLAVASHDLRQPLHALALFVERLDKGSLDPRRRELVGHIENAVRALAELLDGLLDISRLYAGAVRPEVHAFPLAAVIDRVEHSCRASADEKGLRLRVVPSSALVRSDPVLLERVLGNFASNAVRYTERGGIVIGCRRRGAELRIDVLDTGPGIPAAERDKIFLEFYQVPSSTREPGKGLGLGLAIVERLARLLGHRIEVASPPGRGCRFSVFVPGASASELPQPSRVSEHAALRAAGERVLVVEDDAEARAAIAGLLRDWGFEVLEASSAERAIELARLRTPSIVIADLRLGGALDGIELIALLRANLGRELPAALISGEITTQALERSVAAGVPRLLKPVSPPRLRAVMQRLLADCRKSRGQAAPVG